MRSDVALRPRRAARRSAFTLIEMMLVILIIAILVGLLLVGISAARNTVNDAAVVVELDQLQTALTQYKSNNSEFPPSAGEWSTNTTSTNAATDYAYRAPRLQNHFRKRFPRMTTVYPPSSGAAALFAKTFTLAGAVGTPQQLDLRTLDAAEAYLFFLNGPPIITSGPSGTVFAFAGWSTDPANPVDSNSASAARTQRSLPLLEVAPGKLQDQDGDGFPEYYPYNQLRPVVYFAGTQYTYTNPTTGAIVGGCSYQMASELAGMARPYASRQIADITDTTLNTRDAWVNSNGVQLIAAGADNMYGDLSTNALNTANGVARTFPFTRGATGSMQYRGGENDNLTNFARGRIGREE